MFANLRECSRIFVNGVFCGVFVVTSSFMLRPWFRFTKSSIRIFSPKRHSKSPEIARNRPKSNRIFVNRVFCGVLVPCYIVTGFPAFGPQARRRGRKKKLDQNEPASTEAPRREKGLQCNGFQAGAVTARAAWPVPRAGFQFQGAYSPRACACPCVR